MADLITRPDTRTEIAPFADTVAERLLTYALGRGVEYYDMPALRAIVRNAAAHDYRWSSLVLGIVASKPSQMRTASTAAPAATVAGVSPR